MTGWWDLRKCDAVTGPTTDLWYSVKPAERRKAIDICSMCPVRVQCLEAALKNRERWGVWGGVDLEEPKRASRAVFVRRGRPRSKSSTRTDTLAVTDQIEVCSSAVCA